MRDSQLIQAIEALISIAFSDIDKTTSRKIERCLARAAQGGFLYSGRAMSEIEQICSNDVSRKSKSLLKIAIDRLSGEYGFGKSPETYLAMASAFANIFNDGCRKTEAMMLETVVFSDPKNKRAKDVLVSRLNAKVEIELFRLDTELSLVAAKPPKADISHNTNVSNVFNSPVGVFQAGAGSYAVSRQHTSTSDVNEISAALSKLILAIDDDRSPTPFNREELRELVIETQMEISKGQPNTTRLRGLLTTIGGAISMVPKLREAYETFRWAGGLVGATLP